VCRCFSLAERCAGLSVCTIIDGGVPKVNGDQGKTGDHSGCLWEINATDHRPGATDVRPGMQALSPGSVHPFCSGTPPMFRTRPLNRAR
jgi:hypothetical protein